MSKGEDKTYTTSGLTRHFNISVISASHFIVGHKLKPVKTGQHNAKYYSDVVFQQMEGYYQDKPKTRGKQTYPVTKDTITEQLKARIQEQAATVELLKQQLTIKDERVVTTDKLADQAQQLDLATYKQQKSLPQPLSNSNETIKHSWFWKITH